VQAILTHFCEELFVSYSLSAPTPPSSYICIITPRLTMLSPEQTDKQDASTIDREQRTDRVELGGEDL
jgi:hypothetical protein